MPFKNVQHIAKHFNKQDTVWYCNHCKTKSYNHRNVQRFATHLAKCTHFLTHLKDNQEDAILFSEYTNPLQSTLQQLQQLQASSSSSSTSPAKTSSPAPLALALTHSPPPLALPDPKRQSIERIIDINNNNNVNNNNNNNITNNNISNNNSNNSVINVEEQTIEEKFAMIVFMCEHPLNFFEKSEIEDSFSLFKVNTSPLPNKERIKNLIPKIFEDMKKRVSAEMAKVDIEGHHFSIDEWVTFGNKMVSLCAMVDQVSLFLELEAFPLDNYTELLGNWIKTRMLEYSQKNDRISSLVTNLEGNVKDLWKVLLSDSQLPRIIIVPCFLHVLQQASRDILRIPFFEKLSTQAIDLVTYFYKHEVELTHLHNNMAIYGKIYQLILPGQSPNSSHFGLFESILRAKQALKDYSIRPNAFKNSGEGSELAKLINDDWFTNIELVRNVLAPIYSVLRRFENQQYFIHEVFFSWKRIIAQLSSIQSPETQKVLDVLLKLWLFINENLPSSITPVFLLAHLLNPNSSQPLLDDIEVREGMITVFDLLRRYAGDDAVTEFGLFLGQSGGFKPSSYLWQIGNTPQLFWKLVIRDNSAPHLAPFAVSVLSIPATSTVANRDSSRHSKLRMHLGLDTSKRLTYIYTNNKALLPKNRNNKKIDGESSSSSTTTLSMENEKQTDDWSIDDLFHFESPIQDY